MNPILEVRGVSKRFGGLLAVSDVSFSLAEGEILGLIGPNGAGKTTLFNVVNGVYKADGGSITFAGKDITGTSPDKVVHLGLARTHQIVKPLNDLTLLDNVTVGACFGREYLDLKAARAVALEVLQRVGLGDRVDLMARSLTIAGKKRLELARCLATDPELLLLDEVVAGATPTEASAMMDLIRKIRASGVTVIMVEHVMRVVMGLSHRVLVLHHGETIAMGKPDVVSQDPTVLKAYLGERHAQPATR